MVVAKVKPGETIDTFVAQMVGSDRPLDMFRLLNGLSAGQALSVGSSVKIVTDQP